MFAQKYRPQNWQEIVGQEVIKSVLQKIVLEKKEISTFLLYGTRGIGKTTIARILAKSFNCEEKTFPCNKCQNCLAINNFQHIDVIEMDAASKTGVEDVREIIESAQYPPKKGKKKVFIIDEIHMLSKNAFNALLKIIEETPENVIFIFATTEINKMPFTVISRCMKFHLKLPNHTEVKIFIENICKKEKISYNDEGLELLIQNFGSIRELLFDLEKVFLNEGEILPSGVGKILRGASLDIDKLLEQITKNRFQDVLKITQNTNPKTVIDMLLNKIAFLIKTKREEYLYAIWTFLIYGKESMAMDSYSRRSLEVLLIGVCNLFSGNKKEKANDSSSLEDFEGLKETLLKEKKEEIYAWLSQTSLSHWEEGKIVLQGKDYAHSEKLEKYLKEKTKKNWDVLVIKRG